MYSNSNKKDLYFGVYYLMLNESQGPDFYQILLSICMSVMMALILTIIFLSNRWKILWIANNKFFILFLFRNFLLIIILCPGFYWFSVLCIIRQIYDLTLKNLDVPFFTLAIFCFLCLCVLAISGILVRLIIEIPFTFLRVYTKKLFGFEKQLNCFEWYFVGLKNEPKALLYHILNCLRKSSYIIPIYVMWISLYFYNFNVNMVYILTLVVISLIELAWLVYICKVYPYDSLSHNRIIIINQISVVLICFTGIITIKINAK